MPTAFEIQKAVFGKLDGTAALTALLAAHAFTVGKKAIYDDVPQADKSEKDTAFPFVVIGDTTEIPFDTDSSNGRESTLTIHSYSRYRGKKELKDVMDAIKAALHDATLVVSGELFVFCFWEFAETMPDPDGRTRHGVQRFRLLTDGG